MIRVVNG